MSVMIQELVDLIRGVSTPMDHTGVNVSLAISLILEHTEKLILTTTALVRIIVATCR